MTDSSAASRQLTPFFRIWSGQAISLFGSRLVQFALIWWLTAETGSATVLAFASLAGLLPMVVVGPLAGVYVDRWNRRLTLIVSDALVAAATIGLAILFWFDVVVPWHIILLLFVRACAGSFHYGAFSATTPLMVDEDQLTRVQGLNSGLQGALSIIAAPLGALLVETMAMVNILAIDVVTAAIAIIALIVTAIPEPKRVLQSAKSSVWHEFKSGLEYTSKWPGAIALMLIAIVINAVVTPAFALLPLLIVEHFNGDAWQLGIIEGALGIGLLAGGIGLTVWGGFKRKMHTSLSGIAVMGLSLFAVGIASQSQFWLAVVGVIFVGGSISFANGPILATVQSTVDPAMQGRVNSLLASLATGITPLSLLLAGPLADRFGVQVWYVIGGVVTFFMACIAALSHKVRHLEDWDGQIGVDNLSAQAVD